MSQRRPNHQTTRPKTNAQRLRSHQGSAPREFQHHAGPKTYPRGHGPHKHLRNTNKSIDSHHQVILSDEVDLL